MFGLKDFSVDFLTTHHYVVWPVLLLLIVLTIALYRRTNPPLPTYLKIILGALRIVAVVALVLALLEPVFSYTRVYQRPRQIALLLDDSGSMSRIEQGKSRRARRDSLLSTDTFAAVRNTADLTSFNFGGNLVTVSNKVDRDRTSLGAALYELDKHELGAPSDYWLLFTDGRSNSGRHPTEVATNLHTPIVVVDIVSSMGSFDAGINEIDFNPVVFVGRKTEVVIKLNWHQGKNRNIKVELLQGNHVLDSERFLLSNEGGLGEVSFTYVPSEPGQQILKAQVVPIEGEESVDNNQRSFSVKVLKSRLLILIVSEHPDYEAGFLKRYLEQSDKFDVEFIAVGPHAGNLSGRFPNRQTELNRYDLVILHDPDPRRLEPRKD
ncbi:MAG: hypothetical protein U9R56_03245, partial [candidate division Zixibacteria bacterium]|nr:hypothetical protein [candidate division Zixibacteria bacterium]